MKVKLLDLAAETAALDGALEAAAIRVLRSGQFILGEEVVAFERAMATAAGRKNAVAVSSGSDALLVSLWALGIGPGDEVITTPFSFFATVGAIVRLGARPVFVDIDAASMNLDVGLALAAITERTRAIVPVHLFGRPLDVRPLVGSGVPVVEDAAQAVLAAGVGNGRAATLSFFPSKNLGAAGDAGMVLTDDDALAERIRLMRTHGSKPKYVHTLVGGNFRMDAMQAAILAAKLPHLPAWQAARYANTQRYRAALSSLSEVELPRADDAPNHVWHHFVIRTARRDELRAHLAAQSIETEIYYPLPLHLQPCFALPNDLASRATAGSFAGNFAPPLGKPGDCPHAERAAATVLALPIHPHLRAAEIDHVATQIREFFRS